MPVRAATGNEEQLAPQKLKGACRPVAERDSKRHFPEKRAA